MRIAIRTIGDTATLAFEIILVKLDIAPAFAEGVSIANKLYVTGSPIAQTLPLVTEGTGNSDIVYSLEPALPAGLTFNADNRPPTIRGTLTTGVFPITTYTYTAKDTDANTEASDSNSLEFTIMVVVDSVPTFGGASVTTQIYTQGTAITPLTLPQANGGNGPLTYTLTTTDTPGSPGTTLPTGLTFNDAARPPTLTGVPTDIGEHDFIYTVTDADGNTATDDTPTLTFTVILMEVDTAPTFADDVSIADKFYLTDEVVAQTLPIVSSGIDNIAIVYTLDPQTLPAGLTFDPAERPPTLSGTLTTAVFPTTTYTYTAIDTNAAPSDFDSLAFTITVEADVIPAFDAGEMIPEQTYTQHTMITPLTFPQAAGGNGPLTYTLTSPGSMLPRGLTFNDAARPPTLTGVPTDFGEYDFIYTVTDADGNTATDDTDSLGFTFGVSVGQPLVAFPVTTGLGTAPNTGTIKLYYPLGRAITPVTFPTATGGTTPYTYSTGTGTPPVGLTFDASVRVLSGTPSLTGVSTFRYVVTDSSTPPNANNLPAEITICETGGVADGTTLCSAPTFVTLSFPTPPGPPANQAFDTGATITPLTLPAAIGGTGANPVRIYTAMPLPVGLTFDPASRVITGTPTTDGTTTVSYRVGDAGAGNSDTRSTTVTFDIVVAAPDTAPAFTAGAMIPVQRYVVGTMISTLNLPEATGGNDALTYTLTRVSGILGLPPGLTFNGAARPPTITGTPTEISGGVRGVAFTYTVTDADGNTATGDTDSLVFTLAVSAGQPLVAFPVTTGLGTAPNTGTIKLYYPLGRAITPVTFPTATGGTTPYTYSTGTGTPPVGLTFDASVRVLSGTPSLTGVSTFRYVVTDSSTPPNANNLPAEITICETGGVADGTTLCSAPTFVTLSFPTPPGPPANQAFDTGATITPLTLPAAIGGTGTNPVRIYTAMPLPAGLTFDPASRVITGTPTTDGTTIVSYRVGDAGAGNSDTRSTTVTFDIVVAPPDTAPAFSADAMIPVQRYLVGTTITTLTLPEATGGNAPLTYTLTRVSGILGLPPGLTFDGAARPPTITGTPTEQTGGSSGVAFTYTVTDGDGNIATDDTDSLFFTLEVSARQPSLAFPTTTGLGTTPNTGTIRLYYPLSQPITPVTFPAASGGVTPYIYSVGTGSVPVGLTFDADFRVLSGTPSLASVRLFDYEVIDSATPPNDNGLQVLTTICETGGAADGATLCTAPTFVTLSFPPSPGPPADQAFRSGATITPLTLPAATGGTGTNPVRIYTAMPLPDGLTFDPTSRVITGMPTTIGTTIVSYRVGDAGSGNTDFRSATVTFDIVVAADTAPAFAAGAAISAQTYTQDTAIAPLTLPAVETDGNGATTYALTPAIPGLTFDPASRVLSGTPTTEAAATDYTYTAGDSDGSAAGTDEVTLTFSITVGQADPTGIILSVDPSAVTESPMATNITVTATLVGGTFVVERVVSVRSQGGTAVPVTDYTAVPATDLTIPANTASGSVTIPFLAAVDEDVEPAGETVGIKATLLTVLQDDFATGFPSSTTNITIHDPAPTSIILSVDPVAVIESPMATNITVTATLVGGTFAVERVVSVRSQGGTAVPGTDYTAVPATDLTIPANTASGSVIIPFMAAVDAVAEPGGETVGIRATLLTVFQDDFVTGFPSSTTNITINDFFQTSQTLSINPAAVTESATATDITVTVTLVGGVFDVARVFRLQAQAGGTATSGIDYTTVPDTNLTIPANMASGSVTIPFTAAVDMVAEPGGETVNIVSSLLTVGLEGIDSALVSVSTPLTINDPAPVPDTAPTFGGTTVPPHTYVAYTAITPLTLPSATGGNGALTYSVRFDHPHHDGLTFDPVTRVLSGTPTHVGPQTVLRLVVMDADNNGGEPDSDVLVFRITVVATTEDIAPDFAEGVSIADKLYLPGETITQTLPVVTAGTGNITIIYSLEPALPAGLTLDAAARPPALLGTLSTAVFPTTTYTYTAKDGDDNNDPSDTDMLEFTIRVEEDTAPAFAADAVIPSPQIFTQGTAITPLTLPTATGGNGALSYALVLPPTLPAGLTFDAATRVLSGTSTDTKTATIQFNLVVTDADNNEAPADSATLGFTADLVELDTPPAFADDASIADMVYVIGEAVDQALPRYTEGTGNAGIAYTLTPALPAGLTFTIVTTARRAITGAPTAVFPTTTYTLTIADGDDNNDPSDTATLTFTITVEAPVTPDFGETTVPDQTYYPGQVLNITLPAATGGDGALTYTLTGPGNAALATALPAATLNPTTRVLSGTLAYTTAAARVFTYTATDADDDTDSLTFSITVARLEASLDFSNPIGVGADPAGSDVRLYYPLDRAITPFTFPAVNGGTGPYTYDTTSGTPPAGLTFDASVRVLSGTPTLAGESIFNYRVTDSATPTATANVGVTIVTCESSGAADGVTVCSAPTFVTLNLPTPAGQVFANTVTIIPLTLPAAFGGTGANPVRIYTATPLPIGLTFDPASRVISGRPEAVGTTTVSYRVGDAGQGNADFRSTTVTFDIVVGERLILSSPAVQTTFVGDTVAFTLPTAQGGTPPFTYTLTGADGGALTLPTGLTWNTGVTPQTITGMPTTPTAQTSYDYTVTDTLGLSNTQRFSFTVNAEEDIAPAFATGAPIVQAYIVGTEIEPLTLPEVATAGNGATTYALVPPAGLSFDPASRVLSGTPQAVAAAMNYTYTASDSDANEMTGDTDTLTISITVRTPATGFTLSVSDTFGSSRVTVVREGDTRALRALAVLTPTNSVFPVNQQVTLTLTPPPAQPDSAADPFVSYPAVVPFTTGFPANIVGSIPFPFSISPTDDALDYADFPVIITVTASPSGFTATTTLTLLDNDISIRTTTPDVSVARSTTATYNVQLGEEPPATTIVTVASQATATATVSPATLTFSTTNWNTAQPVTVTGVAMGSTTIRHSAPTAGGFDYVTNDVAVTVAAPVFTNAAAFATPIDVEENQNAVRGADYFGASDTSTGNLVLGGADMSFFTLSPTGTLIFNNPPNFEMPRGMAISGTNTNDYALTVTAMNSVGSAQSGAITVTVTNVNDAPVIDAFSLPTFAEYSEGIYTFTATDEDRPAQMLGFSLAANAFGATMTTAGVFTWTPREADGGEARTFTVMVSDGIGTPAVNVNTEFTITAMELPNRHPTNAAITIADGATMVTNPSTLGVSASATDPDTGDVLTYTWSSDATGDSFSPATGASTTWTPPTVTAATMVTLTVTVTDTTDGSVTAMRDVTVNPMPVAPVFTNMAMFTTPISVAENTTAVGAAGFFAATGAITYSLTGAEMTRLTITNAGTLTFNTAPNFEMPRGFPLGGVNTNNYTIGITARSSAGLTTQSGTITIQVTDVNEAPLFPGFAPPTFTEYSTGTITLAATDVDAGQTLTYRVNAPTHGATITGNTFTWTPGEDDGGVLRTFSLTVTDSGTPSMSATRGINIMAVELPNRAPTGATITAAATLTSPNTITLEAAATDPDTGTTLTYTWDLFAIADGSISPINAASTTYTPPTLAAGDAARMIVITLTVSDGDATMPLTDTATHTVTVNPPVPTGSAPAFTNMASFATPISVAENTTAAGAPNFFAAPGSGTVNLTLGGTDATRFTLSAGGTLTFNTAPNFERPRSMAFNAGSNTNNYALTVTAMNAFGTVMSGAITVRVTNVNESPELPSISPPVFTEYSQGTFNISASDVDAGQTLTYALTGATHGATIAAGGTFTWTPGEDDGGELRMFTVRITDNGNPPMRATRAFNITAMELANRAPTGVMITSTPATINNPATLALTATASDPDTGDTLTYTWSAAANSGGDSGTFSPATGATGVTWTPPDVTATIMVTLTVTVSDGTLSTTDTHELFVQPAPDTAPPVAAPVFTNAATFATPIDVAENQSAVRGADYFGASDTSTGNLVLSGADMSFFTLSPTGTLTFNDSPNFEMPRGMAFNAGSNTNNYALTVAATNSTDTTTANVTVRVTDENDLPVLDAFTLPTFTEYTTGTTITFTATDEDRPAQTLSFSLAANTVGAALTTAGVFTWTPGEDDGDVARTFTVMVTDSGMPPLSATRAFTITAVELPNRAPTGATITAAAMLTFPNTITLEAAATDPDTGDTLTYTWATSTEGGSIINVVGATATYTPPTLTASDAALTTVITLTVSDGALSTTATHTVTVNPPVPVGTAPAFTNMAMFTSPIEAAENQTGTGVANFFAAPGTGTVSLTLGGTDATRFGITDDGTLTFNDAPNFEMPRGTPVTSTNTNDYALTVTATNAFGTVMSGAITVRVTDVNEAPVLDEITSPTNFVEYSQGTFNIPFSDPDTGDTC